MLVTTGTLFVVIIYTITLTKIILSSGLPAAECRYRIAVSGLPAAGGRQRVAGSGWPVAVRSECPYVVKAYTAAGGSCLRGFRVRCFFLASVFLTPAAAFCLLRARVRAFAISVGRRVPSRVFGLRGEQVRFQNFVRGDQTT